MNIRRRLLLLAVCSFFLSSTIGSASADQQVDPLVAGKALMQKGDYFNACKTLKDIAIGGNTEAQVLIGMMYQEGKHGMVQNSAKALTWFEKAGSAGNVDGQYNAGRMLIQGLGIKRDPAAASKWLDKAAQQGHVGAVNLLGKMYLTGDGVTKDEKQAVQYLTKAAAAGVPDAENQLGMMYMSGHGVPKDVKEAQKWFSKAAEDEKKQAASYHLVKEKTVKIQYKDRDEASALYRANQAKAKVAGH